MHLSTSTRVLDFCVSDEARIVGRQGSQPVCGGGWDQDGPPGEPGVRGGDTRTEMLPWGVREHGG